MTRVWLCVVCMVWPGLVGACSAARVRALGKLQLHQAYKLKNTDIAKELCLPPVKLHCSSELWQCLATARARARSIPVKPSELGCLGTNCPPRRSIAMPFTAAVLAEDAIQAAIKVRCTP